MSKKDKKFKIVFQEGCFDQFEGTQEELNELIEGLKDMFENMTPEELEANSRQLSEDDLEAIDHLIDHSDVILEKLEPVDSEVLDMLRQMPPPNTRH